jgi:hypothetical protein
MILACLPVPRDVVAVMPPAAATAEGIEVELERRLPGSRDGRGGRPCGAPGGRLWAHRGDDPG